MIANQEETSKDERLPTTGGMAVPSCVPICVRILGAGVSRYLERSRPPRTLLRRKVFVTKGKTNPCGARAVLVGWRAVRVDPGVQVTVNVRSLLNLIKN